MQLDHDTSLLIIGAAIGLVSAITSGTILALVQHLFSVREEKIKSELAAQQELRDRLTGKVTGTLPLVPRSASGLSLGDGGFIKLDRKLVGDGAQLGAKGRARLYLRRAREDAQSRSVDVAGVRTLSEVELAGMMSRALRRVIKTSAKQDAGDVPGLDEIALDEVK